MAAANIASAQSDAMCSSQPQRRDGRFMGMGMAGGMGGMNASQLFAAASKCSGRPPRNRLRPPAPAPPAAAPAAGTWTCSCGATNTGKFCPECGSPACPGTGQVVLPQLR